MRIPRAGAGRLLRDLGRVSGSSLVDLLVQHLRVDLDGVDLALALVRGETEPEEALAAMNDVEHRGDRRRRQLAVDLSRALVTPIDREDLFRLSRSIDDVLDNVRDFVREWTIYTPEDSSLLLAMLATIREAVRELEAAVAALDGEQKGVVPAGLTAKKASNQVRREYQRRLGELFGQPLSVDMLKVRELLRRLDVVGLRLNEAVDVLLDAAVKRGW